MMNCIICRKKTSDLTDEHVIPDALGGYYHIKTVCKKCNSILGTNVDGPLVNHTFSDFMRHLEGIKGKTGKISNPFSGIYNLANDLKQKVKIDFDHDGKTVPYLVTRIEKDERVDGKLSHIKISIDKKDKHKLGYTVKEIAKKNNLTCEEIMKNAIVTNDSTLYPTVQKRIAIDIHKFKIGLLKIAYEFAIDTIPEYYDDPMAIDVSKVLLDANYDKSTDFVNIGSGFQNGLMDTFKWLINLEDKKHYLILAPLENKLICFIKLYKLFEIGVALSNKTYLEEKFTIGINDLKNKSFNKLNLFEFLTLIEQDR